jgi:uncharacterized damage-inducible protein DinB
MITPDYARAMAVYNRWQNRSLYREADALTDAERKEPRGAFFGSIHGTLSHLLFGDQIWMHRFAGTPAPKVKSIAESVSAIPDWADLKQQRGAFDEVIIDWAERLDPDWLAGDLTWYSGALGREATKPRALLVIHFFNHQTHHRGQVHCLLTQFKRKPDDTDLPFMPE